SPPLVFFSVSSSFFLSSTTWPVTDPFSPFFKGTPSSSFSPPASFPDGSFFPIGGVFPSSLVSMTSSSFVPSIVQ
uniref:Uncharacterized protein n=1 Tax=Amphimedon queenslandica TaxID=400682 RepID=A0A1X7U824_AMPQE